MYLTLSIIVSHLKILTVNRCLDSDNPSGKISTGVRIATLKRFSIEVIIFTLIYFNIVAVFVDNPNIKIIHFIISLMNY